MYFFIKVCLFYFSLIGIASYLSLFERKLIGRIQWRYGPRYCGKFGLLQPIADGLKLFFKQNSLSGHSVVSIFSCGLLLFSSLFQFAFLPLGQLSLLSSQYSLLYIIICHTLINFAELLIGVTSKSKYGIIGGIRSVYQKFGSDPLLFLILVCLCSRYDSFDIGYVSIHHDFFVWLLIPVLFSVALINTSHIPFDFLECESDLVAGAYTEYGGILFGVIYLSDYLNVLFNALFISSLFLQKFWLGIGSVLILSTVILIRAIMPRCLQIQMIKLSWRTMFVISIFTTKL